jgi:hypothetical protein
LNLNGKGLIFGLLSTRAEEENKHEKQKMGDDPNKGF